MYAVTLGDDGAFGAEYVRPAAQSIPLGASGSMIEVRMNEDGSYSYMDGGQWLVITADSRMTAPTNGNVYRPLLAPDGRTPVGVMHVAAMQDVTLGALGGTLQLTQAEDMTWWLGDMQVMSGHVHTANGNQYVLTLDAAGMWSAVYQQNMVTVALGTQGSVSLAQAEDMSWWLGTEGVQAGSEVMSDSGNTYTLQYADGEWTARFEPESTAIEGTALVAMSKEDRTGYDVDGAELPASGMGDIATSMGTYRVTMDEGMLAGVRLDPVTIDGDTDFGTIGLTLGLTRGSPDLMKPPVSILVDEDDTEDVNEGMTALKIEGEDHPFSALLGSGVSETKGPNFVSRAHKELVEIRAKIEAVLDVFETETERDLQVQLLWGTVADGQTARKQNVLKTMEDAFGTISGFRDDSNNPRPAATPDDNDALSEIDDLIAALASVDGLAAALADDGTLDDLGIDENDMSAQQIFDATETETSLSYGATGMTRYGAIYKTARETALDKAEYEYDNDDDPDNTRVPGKSRLGAFAFGVTAETDRSRYVASSGNAFYEGETLAVDQGGTHYEGDISLRVRFSTSKVDGLVSNLRSSDGDPWVYLFDEVSSIVLPTANLATGATFSGADDASISYALRAGSTGSQPLTSTWGGVLLGGNGAKAGNQVVGHWSVGDDPDASSYLVPATKPPKIRSSLKICADLWTHWGHRSAEFLP